MNLKELDQVITDFIQNSGIFAPVIASVLICIESILPFLPLSVFITLNFYYFGSLIGFLISWPLTILGCYIAFRLCRNKVKFWFDSKIMKKNKLKAQRWMKGFNNLSFEQLVLILTLPFTPAFLVNIVAGLSEISAKKFVVTLIISKAFLVYFWGFVGTHLLESLTNPAHLIIIGVTLLVAFIISRTVNKAYGIE